MPVDYDEDIPKRFHTRRTNLESLYAMIQEWEYIRPHAPGENASRITSSAECTAVFHTINVLSGATELRSLEGLDALRAVRWQELRESIEGAVMESGCTSTTLVRDELWGQLQHASVSVDYMEKDQLRWWTVADLELVMKARGSIDYEQFRPYFLPVLQSILDHLRNHGAATK